MDTFGKSHILRLHLPDDGGGIFDVFLNSFPRTRSIRVDQLVVGLINPDSLISFVLLLYKLHFLEITPVDNEFVPHQFCISGVVWLLPCTEVLLTRFDFLAVFEVFGQPSVDHGLRVFVIVDFLLYGELNVEEGIAWSFLNGGRIYALLHHIVVVDDYSILLDLSFH